MSHRNIVQVIDFGVTLGGIPYMVLDYFDGINLEKHLSENGPVHYSVAVEIVRQICDALIYAHSQQIWHRDLKPGNVLVSGIEDGNIAVRLIDF